VAISACAACPSSVRATDCLRPQDDFFLISTRGLGSTFCDTLDWQRIACRRYIAPAGERCRRWINVPIEEFYTADDSSQLTLVYVHGNRVDPGEDIAEALDVYRALTECTPNLPPIRLVAFSWPTSATRGLARDFRLKAQRADPAGLHLAWVLARLKCDVPVALVGYSYGARVVTGGMHVLAGGSLCGHGLPAPANLENVHVLLIAAAIHQEWLLFGQRHGMALEAVDRLILINNACDPAMRFYHLLTRERQLVALGRFGLPYASAVARVSDGVYQFDACRQVGKRHAQEYYLSARPLVWQAAQPLLRFETPLLTSRPAP
jgi:hypothetical protein